MFREKKKQSQKVIPFLDVSFCQWKQMIDILQWLQLEIANMGPAVPSWILPSKRCGHRQRLRSLQLIQVRYSNQSTWRHHKSTKEAFLVHCILSGATVIPSLLSSWFARFRLCIVKHWMITIDCFIVLIRWTSRFVSFCFMSRMCCPRHCIDGY